MRAKLCEFTLLDIYFQVPLNRLFLTLREVSGQEESHRLNRLMKNRDTLPPKMHTCTMYMYINIYISTHICVCLYIFSILCIKYIKCHIYILYMLHRKNYICVYMCTCVCVYTYIYEVYGLLWSLYMYPRIRTAFNHREFRNT